MTVGKKVLKIWHSGIVFSHFGIFRFLHVNRKNVLKFWIFFSIDMNIQFSDQDILKFPDTWTTMTPSFITIVALNTWNHNFSPLLFATINYHMWALYHLRATLSPKLFANVARACELTKLDYCNDLLCEASAVNFDRLQKVQTEPTGVATSTPRRSHITLLPFPLQWLPVPVRPWIIYIVSSITYKARSPNSPPYLRRILQGYKAF